MDFDLGGLLDETGHRTGDRATFDPSDLTTHGVIVGMTGSGKTGLGIILLEEALRHGIPCLVIDPKGDMTNLLLTFPNLAPEDFLPWIDASTAAREGRTAAEEAAVRARAWTEGLAGWGLGPTDIASLRSSAGMAIYTPGSNAGIPLNIVGDLAAPSTSWTDDAEDIRDEIQGFVSGLLGLVDVEADPMASREHILLANLIEYAWSQQLDLTLETLVNQVVTPPLRKLGVFDVDTFFPKNDRMRFAMQLNGLLASPTFSAWMQGAALDIEALLWRDGKPQAAIIYLAHLSDAERQFVVTAVFGRLITWMRSQPGSSDLRVLAYMDEVFGFAPPTAQPPAKQPILTLLKQARAFGVGLVLSTQNPVDLDYKAMSNAGAWWIGRLQTERDKARILDGLAAATGDVDVADIDARISGLDKRQFISHTTGDSTPRLFTTRWAMSYLRGPMTRDEVRAVTDDALRPTPTSVAPSPDPTPSIQQPAVADGVLVSSLDPAAPWAAIAGFSADGDHAEAIVALTVEMRFDETRAGIDVLERWEAIAPTLERSADGMEFVEVDHDPRDFLPVDEALPMVEPDAPIDRPGWFDEVGRAARAHVDRSVSLELFRNRDLDLVSRPGEDAEAFLERCITVARNAADEEMATMRDRYGAKILKAQRAYEAAINDADSAAAAAEEADRDAILGAGLDLLMGRKPRVSASGGRTAKTRLRKAEDRIEAARVAYEDLGRELQDSLADIERRWTTSTRAIEPLSVGLEKDDIRVVETRLVWVRRRS